MEPNSKDFFLRQEIQAANCLLDIQAFLLLPSVNVPDTNRLVVASTDEALALEQQPRAILGMAV